jgi:hypothetical protein
MTIVHIHSSTYCLLCIYNANLDICDRHTTQPIALRILSADVGSSLRPASQIPFLVSYSALFHPMASQEIRCCRSSPYTASSPPSSTGLSRGYCVNTILADAAYDTCICLYIIDNCAGAQAFYLWTRRYLRVRYCAGARVYVLLRSHIIGLSR